MIINDITFSRDGKGGALIPWISPMLFNDGGISNKFCSTGGQKIFVCSI